MILKNSIFSMMDLCPVDYLSGFTTRSFVDGIVSANVLQDVRHFHHVFTWKRPASGDALAAHGASLTIADEHLVALLYRLYQAVSLTSIKVYG